MSDETGLKIIKCPECGSEIAVDNRTVWSIDCDCGAIIEKHMVGV